MNHHIDISAPIQELLSHRRMHEALDLIDNSIAALGTHPGLAAASARLRESYTLMSRYALSGLPDPQRPELYADLCHSIMGLADELHRRSRRNDAPSLYFSTLRVSLGRRDETLASLLGEYRKTISDLNFSLLSDDASTVSKALTSRAEDLEKRIFNLLWVTHPLTVDDAHSAAAALTDAAMPRHFKLLLCGAVLLGELEYHDERRLRILMDLYAEAQDVEISMRALCSLLIAMSMRRERGFSPALHRRFEALAEMPGWTSDVRTVFLQFIRTRDTERIGRKLTDEVIPRMMELRPEWEKLSSRPISPEEMEDNPEWAELLEKSGVADRLKELQELQEDGGDVMMATFSRLKTFPFFNDVSNWFLPFHTGHSAVTEAARGPVGMLADVMGSSQSFCDSDKYSIILSLSHVPAGQLENMASQLKAHSDQMADITASRLATIPADREKAAERYVHDLYRFFRLFRRKGEFRDPFATSLNLATVADLSQVFDDTDTLRLVAEFYFRHGHWEDAYALFERLSLKLPPSAELYQKMGHCRQMLGDPAGAVTLYEQAELLDGESRWLMRRLAVCHKQMGRWDKALPYYSRLAALAPDDTTLALNLGHCYLHTGDYAKALQQYYKVEFLAGESDRSTRHILRCALLSGDYERARRYSKLLLARTPSASDLINSGHLELLTGHLDVAADHYAAALAALEFDREELMRRLDADLPMLTKGADIDQLTLGIVMDTAMARSENLGTKI